METREGTFFGLVSAVSDAMDLASPLLANHHKRTAWFAVHIAKAMGLAVEPTRRILIASLLHDMGAFSLKERLDTLNFEIERPTDHARLGASLLEGFEPLREEARLILDHHTYWNAGAGREAAAPVPVGSRVIHLADRTAVLLADGASLSDQAGYVVGKVSEHSGTMFMPEAVEALGSLVHRGDIWSGAAAPDLAGCLDLCRDTASPHAGPEGLLSLGTVFARIIDYRSHFTATHSTGVAAVADALARCLGFSESNLVTIRAAAFLHDIGKLSVPVEILEKPSRLTRAEYVVVKGHAAFTRTLLERVPDMGYGLKWAYQHHERMDGSGYPEHAHGEEIAFGSRVVAVADVMTSVTEPRPYRKAMGKEKTRALLRRLAEGGRLDAEVGKAASSNYDRIDAERALAQSATWEEYLRRVRPAERCR